MTYETHHGRILTWSLEAHVTDHCNLRCAHCCTLSPSLAPGWVRPSDLLADLTLASAALRPNVFKLTGGEPLLHPDLLGCLDAARASGISDTISVTTNGHLLGRAPTAFWERIDRLTLSRYASAPLSPRALATIEDRCARHDVLLTVKDVTRFQRMTPTSPHSDPAVVQSVYDSCWLKARCHMIRDGRLFPCTRPPHIEAALGDPGLAEGDGVQLEGRGLAERLLRHLTSPEPLESCRHCLGATGELIAHAQSP